MSLTLVFRSRTQHTVGPLTSFRLDGEALRKSDGELIASHERNQWRVNEVRYPRLECKGSVSIWFERASTPEASRRFGPHNDLIIYDGVAYIGKRVFASLSEEARIWYSHEIGHYWKVMVVESAIPASS
jgi:hypothetical protein